MRLLLNVIWLVLAGFWLFLGYALAGIVCFLLIVTIPFGVASFRMAFYSLWPFGRAVIPQPDKGVGSTLGNLLWFVLCGWWLALGHLLTGFVLCLTVIGIPLGLANFRLLTVSLRPFGRQIVSSEQAQAAGYPGGAFV